MIISLGVHEAAHAWSAWRLGDSTAKDLGRMTVNPLPHIDPMMTIVVPAISLLMAGFLFGGAKPVPVIPRNFKHPLRDNAIVAICGPLSNFLLAAVFMFASVMLVGKGVYTSDQVLPRVLYSAMFANLILAVFNLVPIPPLDGSRVVSWLLPPDVRISYNQLERYGILIIIGLFYFVPGFGDAIFRTMVALKDVLFEIVTIGGRLL